MSNSPVVFFASADDKDEHLALLTEEGKTIRRLLWPFHKKGSIEFYREPSAEIADIYENFNLYQDRVVVFHYAGHANGKALRLEDKVADSGGLAKLLGLQAQLELVFLNGCSTKGQVDELFKNGVKAVIATSVKIQDQKAIKFAEQFYMALAQNQSIIGAYKLAVSFLETEYSEKIEAEPISRNLVGWDGDSDADDAMPWGLYINDTVKEEPSWRLPELPPIPFPTNFGQQLKDTQEVNQYIPEIIFEMAKFNDDIQEDLTKKDRFGKPKISPREYPLIIIENFPWPISAQLRKLIANSEDMNSLGLSRLRQIVHTYFVSSKFLSFLIMSLLWDEHRNEALEFQADFIEILKIRERVRETYDYMPVVELGIKALIENDRLNPETNIRPFLAECLTKLYGDLQAKNEFYEAFTYLEEIQDQLYGGLISGEMANELCINCEFSLTVYLKRLAFLAHFLLLSVKDIAFQKQRHQDAKYFLNVGVLSSLTQEYLQDDPEAWVNEKYTDSQSVILVESITDLSTFLSVSPFIIDKNAFLNKSAPNIYMFDFFDGSKNYHYLAVGYNILKDKPETADQFISTEAGFEVLQAQFEAISRELDARR
ncbi:MAG: CHAT domain-containing protein [Bacteroidota bacterium]